MTATAHKPLGSVLPDTRGRVSLTKYLPPTPGVYLVYVDLASGVITLRPAQHTGTEAA